MLRRAILAAVATGLGGAMAANTSATCEMKRTTLTSDCDALCPLPACIRYRATYAPEEEEIGSSYLNDSYGCYTRCVLSSIEPNLRIFRVRFRGYPADFEEEDRDGTWVEDIAALTLPENATGLDIGNTDDETHAFNFPDGNLVANGTKLDFLGITKIVLERLPEAVFNLPISTLLMKWNSGNVEGLRGFKSISNLIVDGSEVMEFPTTEVIEGMPHVRNLSLTANLITEIPTDATSLRAYQKSKMKVLALGQNQLTNFSAVFPELEVLHLYENALTSLPSSLTSHRRLQELRVDSNVLDSDAVASQVKKFETPLSSLNVLNMTACSLENALSDSFASAFPNLTELSIALNSLKGLGQLAVQTKTLVKLNASSNALTSLYISLPKLKSLDLSNNKLTALRIDSPSLTTLLIGNNQLSSLPDGLPGQLTELSASGNALTSFNSAPGTLSVLDLSNNQLSEFPSVVWNLTALTVLRLDGNPTMTPINVTTVQFQWLSSLTEFSVDSKALAGVDCPEELLNNLGAASICVLPPFYSPSDNSDEGGNNGSNEDSSPQSTGLITAIAVVVAAILFGLVALWQSKRRKRERYHHHRPENGEYSETVTPSARTTHKTVNDSSMDNNQPASAINGASAGVNIWTDPQLLKLRVEMEHIRFFKVIGAGAFGQVWQGTYRASTSNSQTSFSGSQSSRSNSSSYRSKTYHVAIKTVSNDLARDKQSVDRFVAEIKLQASLSHPRIVEIVGVAWTSLADLCALIEYMPRGDLYSTLHSNAKAESAGALFQRGVWGESKLQVALDIVDALIYVHGLSPPLIHRDLKSRNVLMDTHGRAKLSDFGVSRYMSTQDTMTGGVGSPWWMAPEVILGSSDYDEKADVYSFGVILSELDTHEIPYGREAHSAAPVALPSTRNNHSASIGRRLSTDRTNQHNLLHQIVSSGRRPTFLPTCPRPIQELALRCMAAEPSERPSAVEIDYLLRRVEMDGSDARISLLV